MSLQPLVPYIVDATIVKDSCTFHGDLTLMVELSNGEIHDIISWFGDEHHVDRDQFLGWTIDDAQEAYRDTVRSSWGVQPFNEHRRQSPVPMTRWTPYAECMLEF